MNVRAETSTFVILTKLLVALALVLISTAGPTLVQAVASTRYAAPGGLTTGNCDNWGVACDLQYALTSAVSGDQIWAVQGTYKPTSTMDRTISFALKSGVAVYGGFIGMETSLEQRDPTANVTILSGDIGTAADSSDNSYHVVWGGGTNSAAVLDGFTITAGNANGTFPANYGGGIGGVYYSAGSPTLANLRITDNNSGGFGGGMYGYGSAALTNVVFSGNSSANDGGGFYSYGGNPSLTHVTFSDNSAVGRGGGMFNGQNGSPNLTDVTFSGNSADGDGGGMYNGAYAHSSLTNVTFSDNSAHDGGGIYNLYSDIALIDVTLTDNTAASAGGGMSNSTSSPTLWGVTFDGNSADSGGGISNWNASHPALTNVTFSGNSAVNGGAVTNSLLSNPTFRNVTISRNTADVGGGMYNTQHSDPTLFDTILWGDTPEVYDAPYDGVFPASQPVITDSVIQGGCPVGAACTNVISANPLLGHLADNGGPTETMALYVLSSAIDAGGVNSTCAFEDQRGIARPQGSACDIGAYEGYIDAPLVVSILRNSPSPTGEQSLGFELTFSESVTGVDATDFALTVTGVSGASITDVSGSGTTRAITVDAGSGDGSIRLDVVDDDSILDENLHPLGGVGLVNGDYDEGETYTVQHSVISGNAGVADATLSYYDDGDKTAVADTNGDFSLIIPYAWSGTLAPWKPGYAFAPLSRTYDNVVQDQLGQDFDATFLFLIFPLHGDTVCSLPAVGVNLPLSELVRNFRGDFDPTTVRLTLDDVDVTLSSSVIQTGSSPAVRGALVYTPSVPLANGAHTAAFTIPMELSPGVRYLHTDAWTFTVDEALECGSGSDAFFSHQPSAPVQPYNPKAPNLPISH